MAKHSVVAVLGKLSRRQPAGSLRIAAAPFYFESYDWDAPRWEAVSAARRWCLVT